MPHSPLTDPARPGPHTPDDDTGPVPVPGDDDEGRTDVSTFTARCPLCGRVELRADQLRLVVRPDVPDKSFYLFRCPSCDDSVRRPAGERIVELLSDGGVASMRVAT